MAVASCLSASFYSVTAGDLVNKFMGVGEKTVRCLFETANRQKAAVVFIDEVDSVMGDRSGGDGESDAIRRVKTELLVQMDGVNKAPAGRECGNVLVLAATNRPWTIDAAFRRRFLKRVYIPLPDERARCDLFRLSFDRYEQTFPKSAFNEEVLSEFADMTTGFTGSDIAKLVKELSRLYVSSVATAQHFLPFCHDSERSTKFVAFEEGMDVDSVRDLLNSTYDVTWVGRPQPRSDEMIAHVAHLPVLVSSAADYLKQARPAGGGGSMEMYETFTEQYGMTA